MRAAYVAALRAELAAVKAANKTGRIASVEAELARFDVPVDVETVEGDRRRSPRRARP
jgi:hypothetical protein